MFKFLWVEKRWFKETALLYSLQRWTTSCVCCSLRLMAKFWRYEFLQNVGNWYFSAWKIMIIYLRAIVNFDVNFLNCRWNTIHIYYCYDLFLFRFSVASWWVMHSILLTEKNIKKLTCLFSSVFLITTVKIVG